MNASLMHRQRGILAVFANSRSTDVASVFAGLNDDLANFKAEHRREVSALSEKVSKLKVDDLLAAVDQANASIASMQINGVGHAAPAAPPDPQYSRTFASWVRDGREESALRDAQREGPRASIQASMSVGTPNSGGYLAPTEWDRKVISALETRSPMRRIASVQVTTVGGFTTLWNNRSWGSGWVGETANRAETSTPTIEPIEYVAGEIYANPAVTQRILDDADFDIAGFVSAELADEFARQEAPAFVAGNGVNKPRGFLTYVEGGTSDGEHPGGNLAVVWSGMATDIGTPDSLIDFVYGLPAPYRQNARWLMNSMTAARMAKLKDSEDRYLWMQSYVAGQPSTLLGYPVEIDEEMPDVTADALPLAFGDFQAGYVINDRMGVRMLRDPYTNKPFVHFYATKRVGGGVRDPRAIRVLKIGTGD